MKDFIDETTENNGTPLNRANLMAIQGFIGKTITRSGNVIVETTANGENLTTTFNADGSITEVFRGEKTITRITRMDGDNLITEVLE